MNLNKFFKNDCRSSPMTFAGVIIRMLFNRLAYKNQILAHPNTRINGVGNIKTGGSLKIGLSSAGFVHSRDITFLNIRGKFETKGNLGIGRGCRFDIGPGAKVILGNETTVNALSDFIIMHQLAVGDNCVISWKCQLLDDDFHTLDFAGKHSSSNQGITIGNDVWIGCGVYIYKNTVIPDGCVVASNSVVKGVFTEKNALLAGNPARVIKKNVTWH